jgi:hypothetical protein
MPTAYIHRFYTKHDPVGKKRYRTCNTCDRVFQESTGNGSLEAHLRVAHAKQYQEWKSLKEAHAASLSSSFSSSSLPMAPPKKRSRTQYTLQQSFLSHNNQSVNSIFAVGFASLSLPLQLLEKEEFINMLIAIRQSTSAVPTRKALRQAQLDVAAEMKNTLINRLRAQCMSHPVTIAIDGWTNVRHDKVNNVIPLCGGRAYYWTSIVNTLHRNTAEWLCSKLIDSFTSLMDKGGDDCSNGSRQ